MSGRYSVDLQSCRVCVDALTNKFVISFGLFRSFAVYCDCDSSLIDLSCIENSVAVIFSLSLLLVSDFFMRFCSDSDLKAVGAGSSHNMSSNVAHTHGMTGFTFSFLVRTVNTCQDMCLPSDGFS